MGGRVEVKFHLSQPPLTLQNIHFKYQTIQFQSQGMVRRSLCNVYCKSGQNGKKCVLEKLPCGPKSTVMRAEDSCQCSLREEKKPTGPCPQPLYVSAPPPRCPLRCHIFLSASHCRLVRPPVQQTELNEDASSALVRLRPPPAS